MTEIITLAVIIGIVGIGITFRLGQIVDILKKLVEMKKETNSE